MKSNKIDNLQDIRNLLQKSLYNSQQELINILGKNKNKINSNKIQIKGVHGIFSKSLNDRRDYYWVKIYADSYEYWLTLFYNELDENSGNMHTQIGRIQFWKNIKNNTPNKYVINNNKKLWYLDLENSSQPNSMATFIGTDNYKPDLIINELIIFINNDLELKN